LHFVGPNQVGSLREVNVKNHFAFAQFCSSCLGKLLLAIGLVFCILGLGASASAQQLRITTFNVSAAGTGFSQGTIGGSINFEGEITGTYIDTNYVYHGFVRSPEGVITTFDAPDASTDGYGTFGTGLNVEGTAVGPYTNSNFNYGGFIRRPNGTFETYRDPNACTTGDPMGCEGTGFSAINDFGVIAGGYIDKNFVGHALLVEPDGKVIRYEAPGAGNTPGNPVNISPLGDYLYQGTNVAGISPGLNEWGAVTSGYLDENNVYHGYLRSPDGSFTDFDAPGAGKGLTQGTIPIGLNDLGVITGFYLDSNNVYHGFLGRPGAFINVDAPGADTTDAFYGTQPASLNDLGAITGSYLDANSVWHGFLLNPDGRFTTIDVPGADLTPGDFNGTFTSSINLFGTITGYYVDVNNILHGFVAVPCNQGCSESDETATATTEVSPATATNQATHTNPAFRGFPNANLLLRLSRQLAAQQAK
jgi:hypothetical protein